MTANEYALLKRHHKLFQAPALEVGGRHVAKLPNHRKLFPPDFEYLSIDLEEGPGVDMVHDMEKPLNRKFNTVICCSVLEHCRKPWLMARNIERCLNKDGHLYVAAPFVWRFHNYPSDYWRYTHESFKVLFPNIEWSFLKYATKKRNEVADSYFELSGPHKTVQAEGTALIAVVIGLGVRK